MTGGDPARTVDLPLAPADRPITPGGYELLGEVRQPKLDARRVGLLTECGRKSFQPPDAAANAHPIPLRTRPVP
jgi:hypothetical protein